MTEPVICRSCGTENDDTVDFCKKCGEYLRWEMTRTLPAAIQVQGETPPPVPVVVTQAPGEDPGGGTGGTVDAGADGGDAESLLHAAADTADMPDADSLLHRAADTADMPDADSLLHRAADTEPLPAVDDPFPEIHDPFPPGDEPFPPAPEPFVDDGETERVGAAVNTAVLERALPEDLAPVPAERPQLKITGGATLVVKSAADTEFGPGEIAVASVDAGGDVWFEFLLRNASRIVDNYDVVVSGLPDGWTLVAPETSYLVPYGSGGMSEQTVRIRIAPPRISESEARDWPFEVIALSRANGGIAARCPAIATVNPFNAWEVETEPQVRAGRRRGRYHVTLSNRGNAPLELWLYATNPENKLKGQFSEPMLPLSAAESRTTRLELRPLRPKILGRTVEHRALIEALPDKPDPEEPKEPIWKKLKEFVQPGNASVGTGGVRFQKPRVKMPRPPQRQLKLEDLKRAQLHGAPVGPLAPSQVAFRQKPIIPIWLILVALLIGAGVAIYILTRNHQVRVPQLVGLTNTFSAQERLRNDHLTLNPSVQQKVTTAAAPGTIIAQDPLAGKKVNKGTQVTIEVALGTGKVGVPKLTGETRAQADTKLRGVNLSLGMAEPATAPLTWVVASQIPVAGVQVPDGTPVQVFLKAPPKKKKKGAAAGTTGAAASGSTGAAAAALVVVPPINNRNLAAYANAVGAVGLVPEVGTPSVSNEKPGTLTVSPPPGSKEPKGTKITIVPSGGDPPLAFDDGTKVHLLDVLNNKKLGAASDPDSVAIEPSFSPDGKRFVFRSSTRVFIASTAKPKKVTPIYNGPDQYWNVTFSPDRHRDVLALVRDTSGIGTLCLATLKNNHLSAQCLGFNGWSLGRSVSWAPDGRTILVFGSDPQNNARFGIVRFTSKHAFSTNPNDWHGQIATNVTEPGHGVIAAAYKPTTTSPNVAIVSNIGTSFFRLAIVNPVQLDPIVGFKVPVRACDVAQRPDGGALVIVVSDPTCQHPVGTVEQVTFGNLNKAVTLAASGTDPVYAPFPRIPGSG